MTTWYTDNNKGQRQAHLCEERDGAGERDIERKRKRERERVRVKDSQISVSPDVMLCLLVSPAVQRNIHPDASLTSALPVCVCVCYRLLINH